MDLKELKEILQILEEKEITEFELEEEGLKLRIRKFASNHAGPGPAVATSLAPAVPHPAVAAAPSPVPHLAAVGEAPAPAEQDQVVVRSPMVGTFFRSPDPNSPPFVSTGDRVHVGQVLCIIEAMKLMNEIEAEVAGMVVKIHHDNGQAVQYGEPLFTIRPE